MTFRAPAQGLRVVAAKVPNVCIMRAVSTAWGASPTQLVDGLLRYIGTLVPDVEWTGYCYEGLPGYWTHDVLGPARLCSGIYRWEHTRGDEYRRFIGLIDKPRGW